ncbi:hypothetical protein MNV_130007 [Candidatus Methanoperedens nitroreducens]|uniref:Uncharacterized protein n=1 Tax=Candidatus Methanoperedens nitratireducens TaxID=1392998 RepID=A0A284VKF6_9EURY|nr:hypothetical protein MNV_130007 [Candidatus Methanoperedens nitroreducens]
MLLNIELWLRSYLHSTESVLVKKCRVRKPRIIKTKLGIYILTNHQSTIKP